jgi:hypothetical protein
LTLDIPTKKKKIKKKTKKKEEIFFKRSDLFIK